MQMPELSHRESRIAAICKRLKNMQQAERLWNWIDHQPDGDDLWGVMRAFAPWAFDDPRDTNTFRFGTAHTKQQILDGV